MSSALIPETPVKKLAPVEVTNALAGWWLAIGFCVLLLVAAVPLLPAPFRDQGGVSPLGWITVIVIAAALLVVGSFVCLGFTNKKPAALKQLRTLSLGLLILAALVIAGAVLGLLDEKAPLGPAPILGASLLAIVALLPIGFALMSWSLSNSEAVEEYFQEPTISIPAPEAPPQDLVIEEAAEEAVAETPAVEETEAMDVHVDQEAINSHKRAEDEDAPIKLDDPEEGLK